MERFLRKFLEKVGAEADDLLGKDPTRLAPETLISTLHQAIEQNLTKDQQGVRRVAPTQITLVLSYELHSQLETAERETFRQELTDVVRSYIQDHRYLLQPGLTLDIICDPFLRKPFAVRVSQAISAGKAKNFWLQAEDGREIPLHFGEPQARRRLTLGRAKDNDIVVDDPTVSRFHASLTVNQRGEIIVSDLGSANGTFVNGQRVGASQVLRPNDELTLGSVPFKLKQG